MNLKENIKNVETVEELTSLLNCMVERNYYLGDLWANEYNENKELENKTLELIDNEDYINYLVKYCDKEGDIFILKNSSETIEEESEINNIADFCIYNFSELLTLKEFENYYYLDESEIIDFIDEIFNINENLASYIDYNKIIRDLELEGVLNSWKDGAILHN